jgi:hypothetical protein
LLAVYRRHRQHVWADHSIGHLERILEATGRYQRLAAPPCVCSVGLTGFTRLTEERGGMFVLRDPDAAVTAARAPGSGRTGRAQGPSPTTRGVAVPSRISATLIVHR